MFVTIVFIMLGLGLAVLGLTEMILDRWEGR